MNIGKLCLLISVLSAIIFCLGSCRFAPPEELPSPSPQASSQRGEPLKGIWLAYYEIKYLGIGEADFKEQAEKQMANIASSGFNAVFCHVRPYCDAIYPSEIFPWSNAHNKDYPQGTDPGYDPLAILIATAKKHSLEFHAWINPYRVAAGFKDKDEILAALADNNPAKKWLIGEDQSSNKLVRFAESDGKIGLYLNPAEAETTALIAQGVRELIQNYDIDGIHFDDYFYPTTNEDFDKPSYQEYLAAGGTENLGDWRRSNVSSMISAIYSIAKAYGKVFGISPAAAISENRTDRNYTELYADIPLWASRKGYADYLIPQLYFGYQYPLEEFRYNNLLDKWATLRRHEELKLYVGLGAYKLGDEDAGSREWIENPNIINDQTQDALNKADGIAVFSYSSLFKN